MAPFTKSKILVADCDYDADWIRQALNEKGIKPCIPSRSNKKLLLNITKLSIKKRNKLEIMFGKIKDWRRVATPLIWSIPL
jgi:transposase